jgi:hypothetical protein
MLNPIVTLLDDRLEMILRKRKRKGITAVVAKNYSHESVFFRIFVR